MEDRLRRVLRTFNFREVQTPTFEDVELFTAKSGPGILDEIYAFKDKSGRELCLRPELTAPVMRFYFSKLRTDPKPLRLFYIGACYRYDRPQSGRYREFWQLGTEVIGDASAEGQAELVWLAMRLLEELGVDKIQVRMGHLGVLRAALEALAGIPRADQGPLMRLIDKGAWKDLEEALHQRASKAQTDQILALLRTEQWDDVDRGPLPQAAQESLDRLRLVWDRLLDYGAKPGKVRLDLAIARGLEYYTGLVFEIDCPDLGAEKQLLGGGEYDLSSVFGATPEPTIGFGLGFDRSLLALERTGTPPVLAESPDVLVAALSEGGRKASQRIAGLLRDRDLAVETDFSAKGPKKPLQRASSQGARVAVLIGDREVQQGTVALKKLASGEQVEVGEGDVVAHVERWLQTA